MKTAPKSKPVAMLPEVSAMIDARRQAEQRGNYLPLGRLMYIDTAHGRIQFPAVDGDGVGPDLAFVLRQITIPETATGGEMCEQVPENTLLVLGTWAGLPPLRRSSGNPCPKCRHACDICDGSGKKQCEGHQCGGNGWIPGPWKLCPAPNCSAQKGRPNPDGCETCSGSGQVPEHLPCPMCKGTKVMTCPRCRGTGMFSTGFIDGSTDWRLPKCKTCSGTSYQGTYVPQDPEKFANSQLLSADGKPLLVLGPVHSFCVSDYENSRPRVFDVRADGAGDLLVLIVPASVRQKPQKAYLVGGVIREHGEMAVSA